MKSNFVTLNSNVLNRLDDNELLDLNQYFDPDVFLLVDGGTDRTTHRLETVTRTPVLEFTPSEPQIFEHNGITLTTVNSLGQLDRLLQNQPPGHLCIVSDFIKRNDDDFSLETTWENHAEYLDRTEELDGEATHFFTELPAGKGYQHDQLTLRGIGVGKDRQKIPCIEVGDDVSHAKLARDKFGLQAINHMGVERKRKLQGQGIQTRRDLIDIDPEDLLSIDDIGPHCASSFPSSARAIEEGEIYWYHDDPLEGKKRVYIDIETDGLNPSIIWLIGVYDDDEDSFNYFLEDDDPTRTGQIVEQFVEGLRGYSDATLVAWHGNQFDFQHLATFIRSHCSEEQIQTWQEIDKIDLLNDVVRKRVALPTRQFTLEHVADSLGYDQDRDDLSGHDAARAYTTYANVGEEPDWEKWIDYCREDVIAMKHVYDRMQGEEKLFDKSEIEREYNRRNHD